MKHFGVLSAAGLAALAFFAAPNLLALLPDADPARRPLPLESLAGRLAAAQGAAGAQPGNRPAPKPVSPADEAAIARTAAEILSNFHYRQQPLDDTVSSRLLETYLDMLDPSRLLFVQADVAEFERYRTTLDEALLEKGDTSAAREIFQRYRERITMQAEHALALVKSEQFEFTGKDEYPVDRSKAAHPADIAEAKALWRERLRYEVLQERLNGAKPDQVVTNLTRRYNRMKSDVDHYDREDVFQLFLNALGHVYDPHTDYMGRSLFEDFGIRMRLSLFGIGAVLRSEDGYCQIVELTPGGPAESSGQIKPGDRIVAVAQGEDAAVDVVDMKLNKVVDMIRGAKGTEVRLTVWPADAMDPSTRKVVKLIRDHIKLEESEAKAQIIETTAGGRKLKIGILDLPSFYEDNEGVKSATADTRRLLQKLNEAKIDGLILDLRRNGGGSLPEAINLTGLFLKSGPVVRTRTMDGKETVDRDPDAAQHYSGPMVVLTSRNSASASEILAGALQDYGRAVIVGESATHGKGTVQQVIRLSPFMARRGLRIESDPGALKLTIQKFYRPSGASTQVKGVVPDLVLPSLNNVRELGEGALENPLPWDRLPPVPYTREDRVARVLPELKRRSDARVGSDRDFQYIKTEMNRLQAVLAQKTISLNEAARRKEREEANARAEARKKEIAARKLPEEKVIVLTVKSSTQPGLPAPVSRLSVSNSNRVSRALEPDAEPASRIDPLLEESRRILADLALLSAPPADKATAAK